MSSERIQLPDLLHRLDLKVGLEGELAQKQKNSVYQNGLFDSPDEKDKFSLYYEVYGQGEIKVLFICGFSGDMDIYRRILLPLIEYKEFQCCIYNNRGIPPSKAKKHKSQTIAMMAHDALLLTRHLNVAAASMGAMIALEFACSYTDITQSLIVMCGTAGPFSPSFGSLKKYSANALTHNPQKIRENRAKLMHSDKFLKF
ncbi:MAG: hypothetical protein EZS28_016789 [Streblomastix strix]|uniref:AB hydrolase-1 domain-containing protein n=1 Tax=Streblomastix strix TaxID=222440 RepID=A0A5J4VYH8_9EUKA|nr:MAG: hypothetical protein EZS28_016789 [Streblomastix strix]